MSFVSRWFDWRDALVVVKPATLIRWHRKGFRLFWQWKSRPVGRPRLPKDTQALIRQMPTENPTWGEEHIWPRVPAESPIQPALADLRTQSRSGDRGMRLFRRGHSPLSYPLCIRCHGAGPAANLARQRHRSPQRGVDPAAMREALPGDHRFRFLIHDRDSIFSRDLDHAVATMGGRVLGTPPQAPKPNSVCERLVGTIRRECLDFLIPLGQRHLKQILNHWVRHYNHSRIHMSLGPGIPAPLYPAPPQMEHRHRSSTSRTQSGW